MERASRWLAWLAAPKLTVVFFVATALAALAVAHQLSSATALMTLPFGLLGANLAAAITVHGRFRADMPLLCFHLALLVLVLLFVVGRLSFFEGTFVLTRGISFDGRYEKQEAGPLHGDAYRRLSLINEGFVEHTPTKSLRYMSNRVSWIDATGKRHSDQISEDRPLVFEGYRIYPLRQRGFSPLFSWAPTGAAPQYATIPIPASPDLGAARGISWHVSETVELWASILPDDPAMPVPSTPRENLGAATLPHRLVLWVGDLRHELRPGDSLTLPQGTLRYLSLDTWMGYKVTYDPTKPWLIACVLLAVASLIWFYLRRFKLGERLAEENR